MGAPISPRQMPGMTGASNKKYFRASPPAEVPGRREVAWPESDPISIPETETRTTGPTFRGSEPPRRKSSFEQSDPAGHAASMSEADRIDADPTGAFGYSRGPDRPDTDDAAARAGMASRAYKPMLDDPGDARRAAGRAPTRDESANEDAYVAAQEAKFGRDAAHLEANKASDVAARAQASEEYARAQDEAVKAQLLAEYGTEDPKMIQWIEERDAKNALNQGFDEDFAEIETRLKAETEQATAMLNSAKQAIAMGDLSENTKRIETEATAMLQAAETRYRREYEDRLAKFVAQISGGKLPGQAFVQPKPQNSSGLPNGPM